MSSDKIKDVKNLSVVENIESGTYFEDALNWYEEKFVLCFFERSVAIVTSIAVLFIIVVMSIYIKMHYGGLTKVPVLRQSEGMTGGKILIKKLVHSSKNTPQEYLAMYFIGEYVDFMESYGMYKKKIQNDYIKNNSSYQVYRQFAERFNVLESEIKKNKKSKNIYFYPRIDNIYIGATDSQDFANVSYTLYIVRDNNVVAKKLVNAHVKFSLSDMSLVSQKVAPFSFIVNDYSNSEL